METILFLLVALIVLDLAAWKWGAASSDGIDSSEWERRQAWSGFH
jgi:hypothetical protein